MIYYPRLDAVIYYSALIKPWRGMARSHICLNSREFLLDEEYCSQLKSMIESDTTLLQFVCLSKCFHSYDK